MDFKVYTDPNAADSSDYVIGYQAKRQFGTATVAVLQPDGTAAYVEYGLREDGGIDYDDIVSMVYCPHVPNIPGVGEV